MARRGRKKNDARSRNGGSRRGGRGAGRQSARGRDGGRETTRGRGSAQEAARTRDVARETAPGTPVGHIAIGYTDRAELDRFLGGERGDVVVHGPLHVGRDVQAAATLGPAATDGTPCLVVPLIRERMDEIQREVSDALKRFRGRGGRSRARARTFRDTGGSTRGASAGAIRLGEGRREIA